MIQHLQIEPLLGRELRRVLEKEVVVERVKQPIVVVKKPS